jgi:hypothetical protein
LLNKIVTYLLIFVLSLAYSYETIEYFLNRGISQTCWLDDFHCEENAPESKESKTESGKDNFSDDLYFHNRHIHNKTASDIIGLALLARHMNSFSSSDHSRKVFSPPEKL